MFLFLAACDRDPSAEAPKAVEVPEAVVVADPPPAVVVDTEAPEDRPETPGERVDRAIDATEKGLRTAGEKTGQGLKTAGEKTEQGLKTAADATGRFLKRAGEKLEDVGTKAEGEVDSE